MKPSSVLTTAVLLAASTLAAGAQSASSNPDTPTTLKVNTIVGHMLQGDGKTFDNYYTFKAGPGDVRVRVTLRAENNAGDVEVGLADSDGTPLSPGKCTGSGICNGNNVIASGQGDVTTTGPFTLDANKTIVMHVHGREAIYAGRSFRPTYRITLDGNVDLDKTGRPLSIVYR